LIRHLPKEVFDLFPMWEYQCPNCGVLLGYEAIDYCVKCGSIFSHLKARIPPRFLKSHDEMSEYAHKVLAPKLSEEKRQLLFKYFTVLFEDGDFGSGTLPGAWTGTSSSGTTISSATDEYHHPSYSFKVTGLNLATEYGFIYKTLAAAAQLYVRQYYRIDSGPSTTLWWHVGPYIGVSTALDRAYGIWNPSTSKFGVRYRNTGFTLTAAYESGTSSPAANTWYCMEIRWNAGANVQFWLDGVLKVSVTDVYNESQTYIGVGNVYVEQNEDAARTIWVDCVKAADTGPIGMEPPIVPKGGITTYAMQMMGLI